MLRLGYAAVGVFALGLGIAGIFLPLLPTVPFVLLAAFCFARSNKRWEQRLLDHRLFGPHIRAWRRSGAISRRGKAAASAAFAASAAIGLIFLAMPWGLLPALAALVGGSWVLTRPDC
ncbi:MAG: YbaN family protein [Pseudomonadota bacterium]|nr:YbaN family protein [Pseudomonadota bacterium]